MDQLIQMLNGIAPMSQALIDYLKTVLESKELKKGDFLLKQGRIATHIYYIESGILRCYSTLDEKTATSWLMPEQNVIVSVSSFFNQVPSRESIVALESTQLHGISYAELQHIYEIFPEFNVHGRKLIEKYYAITDDQLFAMRMMRSPERYLALIQAQPDLFNRVPAKHIASFLGIDEAHLSRIRSQYGPK